MRPVDSTAPHNPTPGHLSRVAMGVGYNGQRYSGWQSQLSGNTIQDHLEAALSRFATQRISTLCAGRTDAGVHGLMQVCLLYTSPSPRDKRQSRMPSSA